MVVKNFVFRENWFGSKVAGMKTTLFAISPPTYTYILAPKGRNKQFLKQHFNFQSAGFYPSTSVYNHFPSKTQFL